MAWHSNISIEFETAVMTGLVLLVLALLIVKVYGLVGRVGRTGQNNLSKDKFRKETRQVQPTLRSNQPKITFGKPYINVESSASKNSKELNPAPQSKAMLSTMKATSNKNPERFLDGAKLASSFDFTSLDKLSNEERLQKVLARAGLASRREAQVMIADGRVKVNGKIVLETGTKVNIRKDQVFLDGKLVTLPDQEGIHWVVLNKPKGVVTTMKDEKDRETVLKYLPKAQELRLVPVGRLDKDSTGLLVFTNEVGWIHPLTHLSFMNSRKYQVSVRGIPSERVLDQLNVGKLISKETNDRIPKCPCFIREVDFQGNACILEITLAGISSTMLAEIAQSMNCELLGVKRIAFGSIELKGLRKGDWKELTKSEVVRLKESCMKNFVNRGTTSSEAPREAKRIGRR